MKYAATALALAAALSGCTNGGDGSTVEGPPSTSAPATTPAPATTTTTAATPSASGPSCPAAAALPNGATLVTATVTGGRVTTPHAQWSVKLGSAVRVAVTADVADEVHVHSYDKKQDTTPGCPTAIDFTANIPGTVEVELENAKLHLFDIKAS
ncbi:MAG: hypothetical protein QOE45_2020 [Frankiaceae bacterium]|jgi:glucose/arabinose dehydrogenase|nr:hypothetical protein [Frankiaceae bacterium]